MSMKGGLGDLMKQAQKMQADMQKAQAEIAQMVVNGQAGASPNIVKIELTGRHYAKRVRIDPSLVGDDLSSEDLAVLEDLVAAAFNDAVGKVETTSRDMLGKLTSGLSLPEGFKLPTDDDVK